MNKSFLGGFESVQNDALVTYCPRTVTPDHQLLDSVPNLGPLISRWEINKIENFWYKSVRILKGSKAFVSAIFESSSQQDMSGPMLGDVSNNRWSGGGGWAVKSPGAKIR